MGAYHITHSPELKEVCLHFDAGCQFRCHGCIARYHPRDCHLEEKHKQDENKRLSIKEVVACLQPLDFKKTIFLGREPTMDPIFLPLAGTLKEKFSTHNILLTNGYKYITEKAINEICVSIKAVTKEIFRRFTGQDKPETVLENFKKYCNSRIVLRAESILIPGYIDKDEIEKIAEFIANIDSTIPYRIDGYIPTGVYSSDKIDIFRRPTEDEMRKVKEAAQKYLKNVSILCQKTQLKYKVNEIY